MIDVVCPECGEESEVDPAELKDADVIACEECDAEIAFTLVDGQIVLGQVETPGECHVCELPIRNCTCEPEDEDEEDGDTEIEEVEDEDGDA